MDLVSDAVAVSAVEKRDSVRLEPDAFRLLYERTARPLRAYLYRLTGNAGLADDLMQDSYLRLLQTDLPAGMSDEWLRNYLFRTATNLARDNYRRPKQEPLGDQPAAKPTEGAAQDIAACLAKMKPKERQLLWLAYVEKFTHEEIASIVGAKPASVRVMVSRARQSFGAILKGVGL